jgi:hypothetical protein
MGTTFHQQKRAALRSWPPPGIDKGIRAACERINAFRGVCTTQSCAGHVEPIELHGRLWLHLNAELRSRHDDLARDLLAAGAGVEQAGMLYDREPWPTFEVIFAPLRGRDVGAAVCAWLTLRGLGLEPSAARDRDRVEAAVGVWSDLAAEALDEAKRMVPASADGSVKPPVMRPAAAGTGFPGAGPRLYGALPHPPARRWAMFPVGKIEDLQRGDIVRGAGGDSYVVDRRDGVRAIGIRTVAITNPSEWKVRRPVEAEAAGVPGADLIKEMHRDIVKLRVAEQTAHLRMLAAVEDEVATLNGPEAAGPIDRMILLTRRGSGSWLITEGYRVGGWLALDEAVATVAAVMMDDGDRRGLAKRMETVEEQRADRDRWRSPAVEASGEVEEVVDAEYAEQQLDGVAVRQRLEAALAKLAGLDDGPDGQITLARAYILQAITGCSSPPWKFKLLNDYHKIFKSLLDELKIELGMPEAGTEVLRRIRLMREACAELRRWYYANGGEYIACVTPPHRNKVAPTNEKVLALYRAWDAIAAAGRG